ncbi:MAG TPA: hypothetical protein PLY58_02300 [Bacilli bacterium]|nr:hypothetical protein [Bacilli bacterium]
MVLTEEQINYLDDLIFEEQIYSYEELVKRIGGPRPPIRKAIRQLKGVVGYETCPQCKRDIVVTIFNRNQKFCCKDHKKKYFNTHRKKTKLTICKNCGKEFYQYSFRNNVYCSCSCAAEHREMAKENKKHPKSDVGQLVQLRVRIVLK